ncbi:MAG: ABC transporter substrate-binding protein [Balneolales bacterium]
MKSLFLIAISFLTAGFSIQSVDVERHIRSILETRDNQIKEVLGPEGTEYTESQRHELRNIVNDIMDYREMARYALADQFDEIRPEVQEEFIDLFSKIIRERSLQQLDIYRAELIYGDIEINNNKAEVSTTAILDNNRIPVKYRMMQKEGQWVITDMSVDNAWTGESYRRSFQNIIRRRGFEALMENLRTRAEQNG